MPRNTRSVSALGTAPTAPSVARHSAMTPAAAAAFPAAARLRTRYVQSRRPRRPGRSAEVVRMARLHASEVHGQELTDEQARALIEVAA